MTESPDEYEYGGLEALSEEEWEDGIEFLQRLLLTEQLQEEDPLPEVMNRVIRGEGSQEDIDQIALELEALREEYQSK